MDINITFRHVDSSPVIVEHIERLAKRLARKFPQLGRVRIVCTRDGRDSLVEIESHGFGAPLCAKARDADLYTATPRAFARFERLALRVRDRAERLAPPPPNVRAA